MEKKDPIAKLESLIDRTNQKRCVKKEFINQIEFLRDLKEELKFCFSYSPGNQSVLSFFVNKVAKDI